MQALIPKENTVLQRWTRRLGTLYVSAATATEITREVMIWARGWKRTWMEVVPHSVVVSMCFGFEVHTCCPLWLLHGSSNHTRGMQLTERKSKARKQVCVLPSPQAKLRWGQTGRHCQTENPTWLHQLHAAGPFSSCRLVKVWKDSD